MQNSFMPPNTQFLLHINKLLLASSLQPVTHIFESTAHIASQTGSEEIHGGSVVTVVGMVVVVVSVVVVMVVVKVVGVVGVSEVGGSVVTIVVFGVVIIVGGVSVKQPGVSAPGIQGPPEKMGVTVGSVVSIVGVGVVIIVGGVSVSGVGVSVKQPGVSAPGIQRPSLAPVGVKNGVGSVAFGVFIIGVSVVIVVFGVWVPGGVGVPSVGVPVGGVGVPSVGVVMVIVGGVGSQSGSPDRQIRGSHSKGSSQIGISVVVVSEVVIEVEVVVVVLQGFGGSVVAGLHSG